MIKGITIAGNIVVDQNKYIKAYPNEGTLIHIDKTETHFGGCVCNTAANLSLLEPNYPIYVDGIIGDDSYGMDVKNFFNEYHLNHDQVEIKKGYKTSTVDVYINTKDHTRTFFADLGVNSLYGKSGIKCLTSHLHLGYLLLLPYLDEVVDGVPRFVPLLKELSNQGITISIDLVSEENNRYKDVVIPVLPYINHIIINEIEASRIAGIQVFNQNELNIESLKEAMKKIKSYGVKDLVVVHAPMVGLIYDGNEFTILPSLKLPKDYIVSSVGAGDGFCAGILYGIMNNLSYSDMLRFGSCVAAGVLKSNKPQATLKGINEFLQLEETFGRR